MINLTKQSGPGTVDKGRRTTHIVYLTPDCTDSAVQKRARGFLGAGAALTSFSFRRTRYNARFVPDWPNVEFGVTRERRLLTRIFIFLRAIRIIWTHRRIWREASLVYARNLDLALLAVLGKRLTRCSAPLVYEVLDIHRSVTRRGIRGSISRWLERRVLARCQLLVISSPAFLENYFRPRQHFSGTSFLLENKWPSHQMSTLPRKLAYNLDESKPCWTIGWFGNIRCEKSLEILTELADALPDRVRIYVRGCASLLGDDKLLAAIGGRKNMSFAGEYLAPVDLPTIYSQVHFNWCVDLDDGDNSRWLLPNRLYEGGYFGIPAIAVASHETGRVVRQRQLGLSVDVPVAEQLCALLSKMTRDDYVRLRKQIESLPDSHFVDTDDIARLIESVSPVAKPISVPCSAAELQHKGVGQNG